MLNGDSLFMWQARCVSELLSYGHTCNLLIINDDKSHERSFKDKLSGYFTKKGLYRLYLRFFFKPLAKKKISVNSVFTKLPETIKCTTQKKGYSEYFKGNDIDFIKNKNLDFILRFGFNIIRGEILSSAKYGVWSFHHDDEQKYRGGPPGFWEIYNDDPVTGSILQRLTEKLDGGIILKKGFYKTVSHSYQGQIDNLYFKTSRWPSLVCKDIMNDNAGYLTNTPSKTTAPVFKDPSNTETIKFLFKIFFNKINFHYNDLFRPEEWNVAIKRGKDIYWLPKPERGSFYADPFAFYTDNRLHILFENYNYSKQKGNISEIIYNANGFGLIKPVLEKEHHLSYPFIFEVENEIYCIPESVATNSINLYKYDRLNQELKFEQTLIKDFPGIDSTLIFYNNKWWLFTTRKGDSNTDLYIFHSDKFNGKYRQHHANPVKMDIRNSRPGGTPYIENGILYRPAQNSSSTYGQNIVINKITELTENKFSEIPVKEIKPGILNKYRKGLHTYTKTETLEIIDGKRYKFNFSNFKNKLSEKLHKG